MPDFDIKPAVNNVLSQVQAGVKRNAEYIYERLLGTHSFIGENNVFDILNYVENSESDTEYNYSRQKSIGEKPTLIYTGEGLKQFHLKIRLHFSFCRPDYIIEQLKLKAKEHKSFSYYQGKNYIGEYVITRVNERILDVYDGVTLNAEVNLDILECCNNMEETYSQQTKTKVSTYKNIRYTDDKKVLEPVKIASSTKDIFSRLTEKTINLALRVGKSYLSGTIGGISDGTL